MFKCGFECIHEDQGQSQWIVSFETVSVIDLAIARHLGQRCPKTLLSPSYILGLGEHTDTPQFHMGSKCVPWCEAGASLTELSPQPLTFPQMDFVLLLFCERKGTGKLMGFFCSDHIFFPFKHFTLFWHTAPCWPVWSWIPRVGKDNLELLILPHLPRNSIAVPFMALATSSLLEMNLYVW